MESVQKHTDLISMSNTLSASMASFVPVTAAIHSLRGMAQRRFFREITWLFPRMKETLFSGLTKKLATAPYV